MTAREYAIKLPPDVLMHPMPFPSRLDYAEKIIKEAQAEAVQTTNSFASGTASMARSSLAAIELIRSGRWTLESAERWLNAVINNDAEYLNEIKSQFLK
jgi:hypothetical protein